MEDPITTILQCTRWQEELPPSTGSSSSCRYHYSCVSSYPGNYPPAVDLAAFSLATLCYTLALRFTFADRPRRVTRLLSPAGPFLLPLVLLVLSNGYRVNTYFPLSRMSPALLQLLHVSALGFPANKAGSHLAREAIFEASCASGMLRAAMYVDALVLPYYTGVEVLARSTPTGECATCVCRRDALTVGGEVVTYRGLSGTAACVVMTMVARIAHGVLPARVGGFAGAAAAALEGSSWLAVACDCVYMVTGFGGGGKGEKVGHGAVGLLVGIHVWRRVSQLALWIQVRYRSTDEGKEDFHVAVG